MGSSENSMFAFKNADMVYPHDRFLAWTCLRWLPSWITPNILTMLRLVLTPFIIYLLIIESYHFGVILFIFASFTDALDGSLARTQNKITDFGILLDPLADKLLVGSAVILLVFRYLHFWLGIAIISMEVIFIISAIILKTRFKTVRMANLWGKIKMIMQVVAVSVTILALVFDFPFLFPIASGIFGVAIGFALLSLFTHGI